VTVTDRQPYVWALALVAAWALVVAVIVAAASGEDPTVEAGTVVFLLPLAAFALNVFVGLRGRALGWSTRFAITCGIALGLAYVVAIVVRWEPEAFYLVPIIAFVAGFVLWFVSAAGWLLGSVVRSGLGLGDDTDHDTLDTDRL